VKNQFRREKGGNETQKDRLLRNSAREKRYSSSEEEKFGGRKETKSGARDGGKESQESRIRGSRHTHIPIYLESHERKWQNWEEILRQND